MKTRSVFLVKYFLFWLVFFSLSRILFLFYEINQTLQINIHDIIGIFVRGIWMDLSLVGYVLLLAGLIIALLFYSKGKWIELIFRYFTIFLLAVFSIIIISDLELYRNWGFRIDATPILYLKTPGEAFASVKPILTILLVVLTVGYIIVSFYFYRRWVLRKGFSFGKGRWWYVPVFVFFSALMIIPIRGGFGIAAMNPGKVYFSQNMYSNHAALNPIWNMMYSLSKSSSMNKKYPRYIDKETGEKIVNDLLLDNGPSKKILKTDRPNIVIILLESFSAKMVGALGGMSDVTPQLNKLSKEGILFSRIYASGDRSDKGIVATVSGFPAQSTQSIIKYPLKSQKLPSISDYLDSIGYHTAFYYGGDPDFANIRSYLFSAKFRRIITQDDFPKSYRNSKWGVHDEYVYSRLLQDIDSAKTPFFKMFFTLTSHEPFEVPTKPKFQGTDEPTKFFSSVYYADSCLGDFFKKARTKEWYKNTLFIMIADHGHRYPRNDPNFTVNKFKIPMLWVGGALSVDSINVRVTGSQNDLAATLLQQIGLSTKKFKFSKNLLSTGISPFAYYAFNDGFGFVTDSTTIIFDHTGKKYIKQEGKDLEKVTNEAKAYFNYYQDIFLGL